MAKNVSWSDDYWLLLMQLYLRKPVGVKALYSRGLVQLALELHIEPRVLRTQMFRLRQIDTPVIQQLWDKYATHPARLRKEVNLLRGMNGFGLASEFYQGVEVSSMSWENDFKPIDGTSLIPLALVLVLDLYFRLVPITMVPETPEIVELAQLIGITPAEVCQVMDIFQGFDPYLNRTIDTEGALYEACKAIWNRFGNDDPNPLASFAAQVKDYFK